MKKLALALALAGAALPAAAQTRPSFGVGVGITPVESLAGVVPTVQVYVPITLAPTFRLEPSLGIFTNDQRSDQAGSVDSSNVTVGLGAFFLAKVAEPTDVYVGGRLALTFVSADNGFVQDDDTNLTFAAAIGGEHYLGPRFSIGAEAQLGHYQNGKLSGTIAVNDSGWYTAGTGFLRFYFR